MVVDPSVRVGLAKIKWSFVSCTRDTSKKRFLTNSLLFAHCAWSRARGAVAEFDEALPTGWVLATA